MNDGGKKNLWIINYKSYLALSLQMCLKLGAQWCFCANSLCQRDFKMFIQLVLKWLLHFIVALLFWIHFICSWIPESCFSLPFFFFFFFLSFSFSCFYDRSGIYQKLRTKNQFYNKSSHACRSVTVNRHFHQSFKLVALPN